MKKLLILLSLLFIMSCSKQIFDEKYTGYVVLKDNTKILLDNNLYYGTINYKLNEFTVKLDTRILKFYTTKVKEFHIVFGEKK